MWLFTSTTPPVIHYITACSLVSGSLTPHSELLIKFQFTQPRQLCDDQSWWCVPVHRSRHVLCHAAVVLLLVQHTCDGRYSMMVVALVSSVVYLVTLYTSWCSLSDVTTVPQGIMHQATGSILGTPRFKSYTVYPALTLCASLGIDSGHRQLIAVTCIAEHA